MIFYDNCQRASRAKTRGWRGGSIIEPYEDGIQAIQISSACERCSPHWANRRCAKNCTKTAANGSALKMYVALDGLVPRK